MKCNKHLQIAAIVLTLICTGFASCSGDGKQNSDAKYEITKAMKDETKINMNTVNVTDYGAKDFIQPIECRLDATDIAVAVNGTGNLSAGDNVRITCGVETGDPGVDLRAKVIAVEGNKITLDRRSYTTINTQLYIDSTDAFKKAFDYANSNNIDVVIPEGNYYVDSQVNKKVIIQTNVKCEGKIYTTNKGTTPLFTISRKEEPMLVNGSSIAGKLEAGTKRIPEIEKYADYDVIFKSSEILMPRNNNIGEFYTKNEANRIKSDGSLLADMAESYDNKNLLQLSLYKKERELKLEGLNVLCIDKALTNLGKHIIEVNRSDVTFEKLIMDNENLQKENGQNKGVLICEAVNVTINNSRIRGFMRQGLGYPVRPHIALYTTLNNVDISCARHAVSGMYDNHTTINGGSYEAYAGVIDTHWGHNLTVNDAVITTTSTPFCVDGGSLVISKCDITTGHYMMINRRMDTPSLSNVEIRDTKVTYTGNGNFSLVFSQATKYDHNDAVLLNPDLKVENVRLELVNPVSLVDIYYVYTPMDAKYTMQKLYKSIWVKDLYITGKDDAKLKNTYFRMMPSTSRYYSEGNPDIYLENIRINKDAYSRHDSDGLISYYIDPGNTEVTDTHFNMEIRNCGTLSFEIVPSILGNLTVDNCKIIKCSYYGDLSKDWPSNQAWWRKGTGKTVFSNVKFDRTGLSPSSISIMNDTEFEKCEFTNFGTIDYINFGKQLPTVKILKVKDCIFYDGGITGGSLYKYIKPY